MAILALVAAAWSIRRRSRGPLTALLLYVGSLFPALGFLNVYPFIYSFVADHFAYLAGLAAGCWKGVDEINRRTAVAKRFLPKMDREKVEQLTRGWKRAVERSRNWVET